MEAPNARLWRETTANAAQRVRGLWADPFCCPGERQTPAVGMPARVSLAPQCNSILTHPHITPKRLPCVLQTIGWAHRRMNAAAFCQVCSLTCLPGIRVFLLPAQGNRVI